MVGLQSPSGSLLLGSSFTSSKPTTTTTITILISIFSPYNPYIHTYIHTYIHSYTPNTIPYHQSIPTSKVFKMPPPTNHNSTLPPLPRDTSQAHTASKLECYAVIPYHPPFLASSSSFAYFPFASLRFPSLSPSPLANKNLNPPAMSVPAGAAVVSSTLRYATYIHTVPTRHGEMSRNEEWARRKRARG